MKTKWYIAISVIVILLALIGPKLTAYIYVQNKHIHRIEQELLALANDAAATRERVAKIKKRDDGWWTDGRVGVTGDGYVFFYDLHDSHGTDAIPDTNIFYLPDEKRFIVNRSHFCVDIGKSEQPSRRSHTRSIPSPAQPIIIHPCVKAISKPSMRCLQGNRKHLIGDDCIP